MWLITKIGFFSVVEKPEDKKKSTLTVRARVQSDLEGLRDGYLSSLGPISEDTGTDYKYRAKVPRLDLANAIGKIVLDIDYSNFKNAVAKSQGAERSQLYHELWDVLYRLQSKKPAQLTSGKADKKPIPFSSSKTKNMSYGGVLLNNKKQILLRRPKGDFDGYVWTFPKGKEEAGSTPEQTALREVKEETGYNAEIVGKIPGQFKGGTGITEFFIMRPLGQPEKFDDSETQEIKWVSLDEAPKFIAMTRNPIGKKRDQSAVEAVIRYFQENAIGSETLAD